MLSPFTLRFADRDKEAGFIDQNRERLVNNAFITSAVLCMLSAFFIVGRYCCGHYTKNELDSDIANNARLTVNLANLSIMIFCCMVGMLGMVACMSPKLLSCLDGVALEIVATICIVMVMAAVTFGDAWYLCAMFRIHQWFVSSDTYLVLALNILMSACHAALPIRWFVLLPTEVASVLFYSICVLSLGSPEQRYLECLALTTTLAFISALGKRQLEIVQRHMYSALLREKFLHAEAQRERVASATLISTMCDATFRLASDGDSFLPSEDKRFLALMGEDLLESKLSNVLVDAEQERLHRTLHTMSEGSGSPSALPLTFHPQAAEPVTADLFIADHRVKLGTFQLSLSAALSTHSSVLEERGFLIGVRFQGHIEPISGLNRVVRDFGQSSRHWPPAAPNSGSSGDILRDGTAGNDLPQVDYSMGRSSTISSTSESSLYRTFPKGILKKPCTPFPENRCLNLPAPVGYPFTPSEDYLDACSLVLLCDLVETWNFPSVGCCVWHAALERLGKMIEKLHGWHACPEQWVPSGIVWQCSYCTALHTEEELEACWLCHMRRDMGNQLAASSNEECKDSSKPFQG